MRSGFADLADAVTSLVHDKLALVSVVATVGVVATWEAWLRHANSFAAANLPLATLVMVGVTILVRIFPREPKPVAEAKDVAKTAWSWAKRFGVVVGIAAALFAALSFWKTYEAKALPAKPQQLVSAPSGKRKPSDDDAGDVGDGEALPDDGPGAPAWFWKAKALIGTDEDIGGRSNPVVREMFTAVDIERGKPWPLAKDGRPAVDTRKVPWCAVFVNWCLAQTGIAGTRDAMARSFGRSRAFTRLDEPRIGCVVIMWRGARDDGASGHVGFYAGAAEGRYFYVLGGNQGDTVKVAKFHESRTEGINCGYFWPRGKLESRTGKGVVGAVVGTSAGTGALAYDALASDDSKIPGAPDGVSFEAAKNTAEQIQQTLESTGHPRAMRIAAMIGFALLAIGVGSAIYAWWRHSSDHSEGKL